MSWRTSVLTEQESLSLSPLAPQVYLTASTVYGLEGQLTSLEDAARQISSVTAESELAELEDQVATAAAQVHHAELQVRTAAPRHSLLHAAFPPFHLHTLLCNILLYCSKLSVQGYMTASQELSKAQLRRVTQHSQMYCICFFPCFQTGVQQCVAVVQSLLLAPIEIVWCAVMHGAVV